MNSVDKQYQDLLKNILENGNMKKDRTGTGTKSIFGTYMKIDLRKGFPLLTTKKMFTKGIIYELLWFLKGNTNIKYLVDNGVNIWNDDAYRWYCKLANQYNYDLLTLLSGGTFEQCECNKPLSKDEFMFYVKQGRETPINVHQNEFILPSTFKYTFGDLGDVYGKQWRRFGESNTDQIQNIINTLQTNPDDRRMLCIAYNPDVLNEVALPPCHVLFQFYTRELSNTERWELYYNKFKDEEIDNDNFSYPHLDVYGQTNQHTYNGEYDYLLEEENIPTRELSCSWYQRSVDSFLGLPFNIASYALLTHMIAHVCNMSVGDLIFNGGDTHLYLNHLEQAKELISRDALDSPTLYLNPKVKTIDEFNFEDIKIENYVSQGALKAPLSTGL